MHGAHKAFDLRRLLEWGPVYPLNKADKVWERGWAKERGFRASAEEGKLWEGDQ